MTAEEELAVAQAKSRAARAQLTATMVDIQARLNPRVLLREAVEEVRDTGLQLIRDGLATARAHPGPLFGIAATIAAFVARDWFRANAGRRADAGDDDLEIAAGSD